MTYSKGEQQSQKTPDEVNSLNTLPVFISHKIGYEKLTEKGGEMLERTRYASHRVSTRLHRLLLAPSDSCGREMA
jgi:hypothetical protein